jgi:hypothetical protein
MGPQCYIALLKGALYLNVLQFQIHSLQKLSVLSLKTKCQFATIKQL